MGVAWGGGGRLHWMSCHESEHAHLVFKVPLLSIFTLASQFTDQPLLLSHKPTLLRQPAKK